MSFKTNYRTNIIIFGFETATTLQQLGMEVMSIDELTEVLNRLVTRVDINVMYTEHDNGSHSVDLRPKGHEDTCLRFNKDCEIISSESYWSNTRYFHHGKDSLQISFGHDTRDHTDGAMITYVFDEKNRVIAVTNLIESYEINFDTDGFIGNEHVFVRRVADVEGLEDDYPYTVKNELTSKGLIAKKIYEDGAVPIEDKAYIYAFDGKGQLDFMMVNYGGADKPEWYQTH